MDNKTIVNANKKELLPEYLYKSQEEIMLGDVDRILNVSLDSKVIECQALLGEIKVTARLDYNVMYLGNGGYDSYQSQQDISFSVKCDMMTEEATIFGKLVVNECNYKYKKSLKVTSVCSFGGYYINPCQCEVLDSQQEGIHTKTSIIPFENIEKINGMVTTISNSNEMRMSLSKILDKYAVATINNVFVNESSYQVEGEVNIKMNVTNDSDLLIMQSLSLPFSAEVEAESLEEGNRIELDCQINSCMLNIDENNNKIVNSEIDIDIFGVRIESKEIELITDCYSTTENLICESQECEFDTNYCYKSYRDKLNQYNKFNEEITEICGLCTPVISCAMSENSRQSVEGVVTTNLLYIGEGDYVKVKEITLPFITNISKESCDIDIKPSAVVTNYYAKIRTAQEVEITMEIVVYIRGKETTMVESIVDIELGEPKEIDDIAITLYIVKNKETIWDVAKQLNTEEATLINQNPELKLPLKGGERLLMYKELPFEM